MEVAQEQTPLENPGDFGIPNLRNELIDGYSNEQKSFEDICKRFDIEPDQFSKTPISKIAFYFFKEKDEFDMTSKYVRIEDETLDWLSKSEYADELRGLFMERYRMGLDNPKINIARALYSFDQTNQLGYASNKSYDEQIREFFSNEQTRHLFIDKMRWWTEKTTHKARGVELEEYIKNKFQEKAISIFDVGCSDGTITERIAKNIPDARVTGIDIDLKNITSKPDRKAIYKKANAFELEKSMSNNYADVIVSLNMLRHFNIDGKMAILTSLTKVLKDGGLIMIGPIYEQGHNNKRNEEGIKVFQKKDGLLNKVDFIESSVS